jgi:ribosomal-protein-alanine N-acetyltransferase
MIYETDAKEIAKFFADNFNDGWTEEMLISAFKTGRFFARRISVCNDDNSKILGIITYSITDGVLDIEDIVVDKEQRRAGIGSSLLKKVFEEAQTDGVKRVMLEVRESNLPAINLYRKFGFKDLSTRKKYYQDGENALVMEKEF